MSKPGCDHYRGTLGRLLLTIFLGVGDWNRESAAADLGYYRQPAIHGDGIVFIAEGDLWSVPLVGGRASRLTAHPGIESAPAISPDGNWIAFTARYEGPMEVYLMPRIGGRPRRLTFDAAKIASVGWTPDGRVLVSTDVHSGLPNQQLITLDVSSPDGAVTRTLVPLAQAADGAYSKDGQTLFFTRLNFQGSHTKRYKGGTAQKLWSFHEGDLEAKPLTSNYDGTSKSPIVWQERIYFLSDRDGTMNIWSIMPDGSDAKQHTQHAGYDIATCAGSDGRIVYQIGADLRLFDATTDTDALITITLDSDLDHTREKWIKDPIQFMTNAHPSPDGSKVVVTARGRVFVIPRNGGRLVEAARKAGVRYRDARFMPDGNNLLIFSDESGEVELGITPADGLGEPALLTHDGATLRHQAIPSPDGKFIAHTDKNLRLFLLNVESKENKLIAETKVNEFDDLVWSPDSKQLAFVEQDENLFRRIKLYVVSTGQIHAVTTNRYDSYSPAFSPDGKWLYLLSDRNLKSVVRQPWGSYQPEPFLDKKTRIYQLPLMAGLRSPFAAPDELASSNSSKPPVANAGEANDLAGLAPRIQLVPVPPGNYRSLVVTDKFLFWLSLPSGENRTGTVEGIMIGNEELEVKPIGERINTLELSGDGKKLLLVRDRELALTNAALDRPDPKKTQVDTSGWSFVVSPREEWQQMFREAWRLERDYFYDRGMHGQDWLAVRKKYEPLLPRVTDRHELDDLIAQMVSELSALHTYVRPGDVRRGPDDVMPARLGGALVRDTNAGGYRVERVYLNDPDEPERASPLARPDVDVKAGDVIISINGQPTLAATDIGELLRRMAGRQVLLTVKTANGEIRKVVTRPMSAMEEVDLRYHEWEYTRRLAAEKQSNGTIGYVHLRAMGGDDFESWARHFYPAFTKGGLIIDVRNNRGGNIDSWIISRLLRKAWSFWNQRVGRSNLWNMQYAFRGHVVILCNEWTASDGEAFCEAIKRLKLGTVIGTRTWGGEIWLRMDNFLVDNGIASAAEFGVFDQHGSWLIEGHGVDPDQTVDNLPHATFSGEDAQLVAAINLLTRKLQDEPIELPEVPTFPKK